MSSLPLSLCFTCVGQERAIIAVDAHSSLFDLHQVARDTYQANDVILKHGFPPTLVSMDSNITCTEAGIQDKDRIVVTIVDTNTTKKVAPPPKQHNKKRTQRAAAKAATDSFGDVIRAQDNLMRQEEGTSTKKSGTRSPRKRRAVAKKPNFGNVPAGRRLQDGAAVTTSTNTTKRQKQSNGPKLKNQEDVSMALLNALQGGKSNDKVGQVLRGAMRNAITNRYEASRAVSKVNAVQSNQYTIQEKNGILAIEYNKGLEGRGMFEETVDCIPREALEAVIRAIHQNDNEREMLQPATLAQTSPRVFWSLVWLYQENASITTVEQCLSTLLPDLDWSFQNKRKRALSSKAKENLRQEQTDIAGEENEEAAQEAVQAVESAMEQLGEYDASQRRERAARAALSRHGGSDNADGTVEENGTTATRGTRTEEWKLVTPTQRDDDELQECIAATTSDEKSTILTALHSLDIYNWRQLANANAETICQATNIPQDQVEQWIDYAQAQSLEEIVVEICNGNVNAIQVLRDEARTGTVKDLSNWRNMPDMLYSSAPSLAGLGVDVEDVSTWCQRAQAVSEEFEWVQWYATPVE